MPQRVTEVDELQEYISGVMKRADHHAEKVKEVLLTLTGALIWKKDSTPIKVLARDGEMKNVLWVTIKGKRYVFSYNHESGQIDMHGDSIRGTVVHSFSNADSAQSIMMFFRSL